MRRRGSFGMIEARTGHVDTFCADNAPPVEMWPVRDWSGIPELAYPDWMNCGAELLDTMIEENRGDRIVFLFPEGQWTYRHLYETANRIAHVLVDDLVLIPGNRVLLRGPNNPMLAACWFAVLKAGGVVVCTMPLLRERELKYLAKKAEIDLALTDVRFLAECEDGFREREAARVISFTNGETKRAEPGSLESMMGDKPATFANCDTAAEDIAIIAFTSGT